MENEERLQVLSKPMRKAFEKIIERCEEGGIKYEWQTGFEEEYALTISIQKGRSKHRIILLDAEDAQRLLDLDFEKYVFIEGYRQAICCYEKGYVEAAVEFIGPAAVKKTMLLGWITGRGYKEVANEMKDGIDVRLELVKGDDKKVRVSVGSPSKMLLAMLNFLVEEESLSVRLEGLTITKNKEAAEQLERITNSMFFELKKKRNVSLFVPRHYEIGEYVWTAKSKTKSKGEQVVGFPKYEYDKQPMEMYWHAVSAYNMPLLQYLAYYQILEYYFTKYSLLGARKEIRNCLKDPEFNADDENDIGKIVTCVSGRLGRYVSENDLLRDTIRECVSEEELVLEVSDDAIKEYFKKDYKIVSQFKVSQENKEKEIREQLAERIYDIRCRIVHTKEDDKRGRIIPFTREAVLLREFDLPMIEGIVNKVLIENSKQLSL